MTRKRPLVRVQQGSFGEQVQVSPHSADAERRWLKIPAPSFSWGRSLAGPKHTTHNREIVGSNPTAPTFQARINPSATTTCSSEPKKVAQKDH